MVTDDEGILIARSREGDWDAFAGLIRTHQRMIHALAYRMSGSAADADDLTQETFIRAHHALAGYRGSAKFSSWLYRIALNACLQWRRVERRRGEADRAWAADEAEGATADPRVDQLQAALVHLPPAQRAAVVLTAFEGRSHAEAAGLLGCAEATLSWRLFAARRRLARLLAAAEALP